jgi:hypothetical protein
MNRKMTVNLFFFIFGFFFFLSSAFAAGGKDLLHFRSGVVTSTLGSFSNPTTGATTSGFTVAPSFDFEYEIFYSERKSYAFRGTLAIDFATSVTRYIYGGAGQRFYLNSRGSPLEFSSSELSINVLPKIRYFIGWEIGVSQAVVNIFTSSLQTVTTALDGGGIAGAMYQISKDVAIEGSMTVSYAFGFSSVGAAGTVAKGFLGGIYAF